jgi:plasmid stabilization system protein ParE
VKRLRLTPEAELDLDEAYGQLVDPMMRGALLRRFPYAVFYEVGPVEILVYAVFHGARNPTAWKRRRET